MINRTSTYAILGLMLSAPFCNASAAETQVERGKYLVSVIPCTDCHTPGYFLGKPDMARYLGGSDVGFEVPGLGVFYAPNLTPDDETGLGSWTKEQIATAITTGKRPDGRILAPPMPVESFKHLNHSDALAIAAYLKSLPAVKNKVPGPFGARSQPHSSSRYFRRTSTHPLRHHRDHPRRESDLSNFKSSQHVR